MEIFILVSVHMQTSGAELQGPQLNLSVLSEARSEPPPFPACPVPPDLLLQFICLKRCVKSLKRGGEALRAIDSPAGSAQLCAPVTPAWLCHFPPLPKSGGDRAVDRSHLAEGQSR